MPEPLRYYADELIVLRRVLEWFEDNKYGTDDKPFPLFIYNIKLLLNEGD